jgi:dephospho-CoA kinase
MSAETDFEICYRLLRNGRLSREEALAELASGLPPEEQIRLADSVDERLWRFAGHLEEGLESPPTAI